MQLRGGREEAGRSQREGSGRLRETHEGSEAGGEPSDRVASSWQWASAGKKGCALGCLP